MKRNLLSLTLGLFLIIFSYRLSAQNVQVPANQTSPTVMIKGNSGLQAYHYFRSWRAIAFGLSSKDWRSNLIGSMPANGAFGGSGNTATGTQALFSNSSGSDNTADGYQSLYSNTTGGLNVAIGYQSLYSNSNGSYNIAAGYQSLYANTSGSQNIAIGTSAMSLNTTGYQNTAIGGNSMSVCSTGSQNTAYGYSSMFDNLTGLGNTALGAQTLTSNSSGDYITAVGFGALAGSRSESYSVAVGYSALVSSNSSTGYNTAVGPSAMYSNTSGYDNAANGASALYTNNSGYYNSASGALSMYSNTSGSYNSANGAGALYNNTSGSGNVAMGELSMYSNSSGNYNTGLGFDAGPASGSLSNATALGANSIVSSSNQVVIGSSSVTSIGGYANWSNFSDGRYKKNIQQNVPGLAFINKLKPITYTLDIDGIENKLHETQKPAGDKNFPVSSSYQNDPVFKQSMQEKAAITYSGFVAQDVEKSADSLGYDFSGVDKPKDANQSFYGLRYGDFVVPLVRAVQELSKINDSLNSKMDSMQQQINELRALVLSKTQFTGSVIAGASLDQNVPNPTSNSTTIGYSLPQGVSAAQIEIVDMTGRILQIIPLSGVGRNTLTIDTSSFASGTYSYSLIIDGQLTGTKKMVSVR